MSVLPLEEDEVELNRSKNDDANNQAYSVGLSQLLGLTDGRFSLFGRFFVLEAKIAGGQKDSFLLSDAVLFEDARREAESVDERHDNSQP